MNKALILFGTIMIIFGIVVFYLIITSMINLGKSITEQYSTLSQIQRNKINSSTLISAVIVLIGGLIVGEGFKR